MFIGSIPRQTLSALRQFHNDQRGAEGLEKLLIVAAVVLPLLGVLIVFRNELAAWVKGLWKNVQSDANQPL